MSKKYEGKPRARFYLAYRSLVCSFYNIKSSGLRVCRHPNYISSSSLSSNFGNCPWLTNALDLFISSSLISSMLLSENSSSCQTPFSTVFWMPCFLCVAFLWFRLFIVDLVLRLSLPGALDGSRLERLLEAFRGTGDGLAGKVLSVSLVALVALVAERYPLGLWTWFGLCTLSSNSISSLSVSPTYSWGWTFIPHSSQQSKQQQKTRKGAHRHNPNTSARSRRG